MCICYIIISGDTLLFYPFCPPPWRWFSPRSCKPPLPSWPSYWNRLDCFCHLFPSLPCGLSISGCLSGFMPLLLASAFGGGWVWHHILSPPFDGDRPCTCDCWLGLCRVYRGVCDVSWPKFFRTWAICHDACLFVCALYDLIILLAGAA